MIPVFIVFADTLQTATQQRPRELYFAFVAAGCGVWSASPFIFSFFAALQTANGAWFVSFVPRLMRRARRVVGLALF
jgi:hypothetical protein